MLIPITRHGFTFWEAPRSTKPPLDDLPEPQRDIVQQPRQRRIPIQMAPPAEPESIPINHIVIDAPPADTPEHLRDVQRAVMEVWNIQAADFFGRTRLQHVALARMVSMALCRTLGFTATAIARAHYRVHGLVCHACEQVENLRETDPKFRAQVDQVESHLAE